MHLSASRQLSTDLLKEKVRIDDELAARSAPPLESDRDGALEDHLSRARVKKAAKKNEDDAWEAWSAIGSREDDETAHKAGGLTA